MGFSESNSINELHTDKLIEKYGGFKVSIISQEGNIRISELRDLGNTLRTFAISFFSTTEYSTKLKVVHDKILNGMPIGDTLRNNGFDVQKEVISNFVIEKPKIFQTSENFTHTTGQLSKISCRDELGSQFYAEVCEIYCPCFQIPKDNLYSNDRIATRILELLTFAEIQNLKYKLTI